ncbi:hypothetical protein KQX54_002846 [Cotesia glomerata]|uniref:Uncharacterized protein n=1 Tax=Cotesia glomerata TaxID=32391 RepID=A0AAV7IJ40_COTGL|nr:hypothetical protein KQX54_002846 [Cotesia glomerata]
MIRTYSVSVFTVGGPVDETMNLLHKSQFRPAHRPIKNDLRGDHPGCYLIASVWVIGIKRFAKSAECRVHEGRRILSKSKAEHRYGHTNGKRWLQLSGQH